MSHDPLEPCPLHPKCPVNVTGAMMGAVSHAEESRHRERHRQLLWLLGLGDALLAVLLVIEIARLIP